MTGRFPRISTRGYYDLGTGRASRPAGGSYRLFPKSYFVQLAGVAELVIMVHGLRNDPAGALAKFMAASQHLGRVGYTHPVVGYSYDSNTRGAHLAGSSLHALRVGQQIARRNGRHLAAFISDFKASSNETRIRLIGHSLGSKVILHASKILAGRRGKGSGTGHPIESVHFFGASVTASELSSAAYSAALQDTVASRVVNYFSPGDEVLGEAHESGEILHPVGYTGCRPKPFPKYSQKKVWPENHRFVSYAATIESFP